MIHSILDNIRDAINGGEPDNPEGMLALLFFAGLWVAGIIGILGKVIGDRRQRQRR